ALVIAIAYTINKLNTDSEIVVMNAAGMSPWRLFRPFLAVAITVSLIVAAISAYVAPKGLRELREWATKVRTDVVANIVQPGRFLTIEPGLTFHLRERRPNGQLIGIFMDDKRDPKDHQTFLAEYGEIVESGQNSFLVLYTGSLQRLEAGKLDPTIVPFAPPPFALTHYGVGAQMQPTIYGVRERYLWDLASPDPNDLLFQHQPAQLRAEFHDRLVAPIYPLAFVLIAFAILGAPRTTRQSRTFSLGLAITCVFGLRFIGFAGVVFGVQSPAALGIIYVSLGLAFVLGILAISRGATIEPPAFLIAMVEAITERFMRRLVPT